jgi:hypothetical protein
MAGYPSNIIYDPSGNRHIILGASGTDSGGIAMVGIDSGQYSLNSLLNSGWYWGKSNDQPTQAEITSQSGGAGTSYTSPDSPFSDNSVQTLADEAAQRSADLEEAFKEFLSQQEEYFNSQKEYLASQKEALAKAQAESDAETAESEAKKKRRLAVAATGKGGTLLTGGMGLTTPAQVGRKTLLGQ